MKVYKLSYFDKWFKKIKDVTKQSIILTKIANIENGNLGDYSSVGDGVLEFRIHKMGGIRLYFYKMVIDIFCF